MAKKKKKVTGLWLPLDILKDENLTANQKLFLSEILALNKKRPCIASNGHFSDLFGVNKPNCTRIIKSLEAKGYVKIHIKREGKKIVQRQIRATLPYYQNDNTRTIKKATTYYQNDNNLLSKRQRENTYRKQIENSDLINSDNIEQPDYSEDDMKYLESLGLSGLMPSNGKKKKK